MKSSLSVEYKVNFGNGNGKNLMAKKLPARPATPTNKPPHITRLLALAHHLQDLLDQGIVHDYADIARLTGLSRARVTQIMNLTLLAPEVQEELLTRNQNDNLRELDIREVLKKCIWQEQTAIWRNKITGSTKRT